MSTAKLGILTFRDPISSQRNTSIYMDNSGYIKIDRPDGLIPTINSRLIFNTTAFPVVTPITFTHANVFSNTDPYLSGTLRISNTGINCNQPVVEIQTFKNDSSYGNGPSIIFVNKYATSGTDTTSVDIEIIANNSFVNAYNGKWEFNALCGRTSGTADTLDGFFSIAYRVGAEDTGGANSRFRRVVNFYPNTIVGKGKLEHRGSGILINPEFNHTTEAYLDIISPYNSGRILVQSTSTNGEAYLQLFSNSPGTSTIGGNYKIIAGADNRLTFKNVSAGNVKCFEVLPGDAPNRGVFAIYNYADATKAELRFGDSVNGQIIKGENKIFNFATVGNKTKITTDSSYYVRSSQVVKANIALNSSNVSTTITNAATECTLWVNVTTNGSAQYNVIVPTAPNNGFILQIVSTGNVSTLLISSEDPNSVLPVSFTENVVGLITGVKVELLYYAADNKWIIMK